MAERNPNIRAELERKRVLLAQKIAQKKEAAERRRYDRLLQDENANPDNFDDQPRPGDADDILRQLGLSPALSRASTAPSNVSAMEVSRSQLINNSGTAPSPDVASQQQQFSTSLNVDSSVTKPAVPLEVVHVNQINIVPQEKVVYTKSTQTVLPHPPTTDPSLPEDAIKQNKYYGKQAINANNPPARLSENGQRTPNDSLSHNTQVTGANQLANLEWDDEFPGMFRLDLYVSG